MPAHPTPTWAELMPLLETFMQLPQLTPETVGIVSSLGSHAMAFTRSADAQLLPEVMPLIAKAAAHALNLVSQQSTANARHLDDCLDTAAVWMSSLTGRFSVLDTTNEMVAAAFNPSTGLLAAMAALFALVGPLLGTPRLSNASLCAWSVFHKGSSLYAHLLAKCGACDIFEQPVLSSAAAPILAACWQVLRREAPAAAAPGVAARVPFVCAKSKEMALLVTQQLAACCFRCLQQGTPAHTAQPAQLRARTVLGSPAAAPLLMAQLAVSAGFAWHTLPGQQSVLQAPVKVPLKGFGDVRASSSSSSSSSSAAHRTSSRDRQHMQSTTVEPAHLQLLQHLGVVLPPVDSLRAAPLLESLGGNLAALNAACCLQTVLHWEPVSPSAAAGGSVPARSLDLPTLCGLVRVQLQVLLMEDSHVHYLYPYMALADFLGVLDERWSNPPGSRPAQGTLPVATPAPSSVACVYATALHVLQNQLHHVVPALLCSCVKPWEGVLESHTRVLALLKMDLARQLRWCVSLSMGGCTTVGSWQQLAATDRAVTTRLIEQQPLHSLLSLELAFRAEFILASSITGAGGTSSLEDQFACALALFGVPEEGGWAERSFHELGLLSPQLMQRAGSNEEPGLRQRVLSLMTSALKLAVKYAELARPMDKANDGVMATGLVTGVCHAFLAFCKGRPSSTATGIPAAAAAELDQEVLAMLGRLLHTAGRMQQLLYSNTSQLPVSGRAPVNLLKPGCYKWPPGHWLAIIKLQDLWTAVEELLGSNQPTVSSTLHIFVHGVYDEASVQPALLPSLRQQQQVPDEILQPLLQQERELKEQYTAPWNRVKQLSDSAWAEYRDLRSVGLGDGANWREQVPEFLQQATGVAVQLQDYGAALAALFPSKYLCNNLKCGVMEHETESAAAAKLCSQCKQARYCCVDCQHAHWRPLHKPTCSRLRAASEAAAGAAARVAAAAAAAPDGGGAVTAGAAAAAAATTATTPA